MRGGTRHAIGNPLTCLAREAFMSSPAALDWAIGWHVQPVAFFI